MWICWGPGRGGGGLAQVPWALTGSIKALARTAPVHLPRLPGYTDSACTPPHPNPVSHPPTPSPPLPCFFNSRFPGSCLPVLPLQNKGKGGAQLLRNLVCLGTYSGWLGQLTWNTATPLFLISRGLTDFPPPSPDLHPPSLIFCGLDTCIGSWIFLCYSPLFTCFPNLQKPFINTKRK